MYVICAAKGRYSTARKRKVSSSLFGLAAIEETTKEIKKIDLKVNDFLFSPDPERVHRGLEGPYPITLESEQEGHKMMQNYVRNKDHEPLMRYCIIPQEEASDYLKFFNRKLSPEYQQSLKYVEEYS